MTTYETKQINQFKYKIFRLSEAGIEEIMIIKFENKSVIIQSDPENSLYLDEEQVKRLIQILQ